MVAHLIYNIVELLYRGVYMGVGIAALVGAVLVLMTRDDAFSVADRQPKAVWAALLFVCAIVLLVPFGGLSILTWVAAVVVGVYWFDVRPQIRNILNGNW